MPLYNVFVDIKCFSSSTTIIDVFFFPMILVNEAKILPYEKAFSAVQT